MAIALAGAAGCSRSPIVQSELPIKRVVVYRNGVAYFERGGHVDRGEVHFKMKQSEVGDFLATLAVMEQGGSSVKAAAFPLDMDKDNEDARPQATGGGGNEFNAGMGWQGGDVSTPSDDAQKRKDARKKLRTVALALDGREHDLQIGYVAAAPVWRPSYRLVVQAAGQADLQAWGIVENLSGEDWSGVQLSLVAGAPLAFEAQLGTPVIPDRPIVTDQGEVIAAMPKSDTSVEQDEEKPVAAAAAAPAPAAPPPPPPAGMPAPLSPVSRSAPGQGFGNGHGRLGGGGGAGGPAQKAIGAAADSDAPMEAALQQSKDARFESAPSTPRNVRSLAAIAVQGGSTRYDIPSAVTVPDDSATMVMLLAKRVTGESTLLFSPDGGVPDSTSHPFHVARFTNGTTGVLERGPIAVFEQGSFVGQGLLDPLPAGATATVPFALERSIGIQSHQENDVQGARVWKIENGTLWIERDRVLKTIYAIENGGTDPAKILVKHPRLGDARLFQPPPGTEDNTGTGSALVPMSVGPHAKGKLVVDERSANHEYADWFSVIAENAVKAYLADPKSNQDVVQKLSAIWSLRGEIVTKQDARNKAQAELSALANEAQEKRADLKAIEKNKAADALRKTLTARLTAIAARQDVLSAQTIQLQQDLSEMQIRWREGVKAVHLVDTPPSGP